MLNKYIHRLHHHTSSFFSSVLDFFSLLNLKNPFKKATNYISKKNQKLIFYAFLWVALVFIFYIFQWLSSPMSQICQYALNIPGPYETLMGKILCSNSSQKQTLFEQLFMENFKSFGLIHLLVASGAHLIILKNGLTLIFPQGQRYSSTLIHIFLFIFVIFSGLSLPIFRSWLQLILAEVSKKLSLALSPSSLVFVSSGLLVFLFPPTLFKLSFYLSVTASLCLAFFSLRPILSSCALYFGLLPFIVDFGAPHPSSILINILITPVLAPILLLTCFFAVPLIFFSINISPLLHHYLAFFNIINDQISAQTLPPLSPIPLYTKSIYFLCVCLLFILFSLKETFLKKSNLNHHSNFKYFIINQPPKIFIHWILITFSVIFYPYLLKDSTNYNVKIFWNFGYSNWLSIVQPHHCLHIDPGGSKPWRPQLINHFCNSKHPQFYFLNQDRFHNKYKQKIIISYLLQSHKSSIAELEDYRLHLFPQKENIYTPYKVIDKILLTGHAQHLEFKEIISQNKNLILSLPNHGQSKYWSKSSVIKSRRFLMRITGSKSKNNQIHQKTYKKFNSLNTPVIYKPIWGHLIIEK